MSLNLQAALKALPNMSVEQMADLVTLLDEVEERTFVQKAQANFVAFIKAVETALDAPYKLGAHLKRLISLLEDVERGEKDRIAVSIAPRFGKSQTISILYPAWYLGRHPDHKVIVASHTADLAVDMARKVRNLMQTNEYKRIFPGVAIAADAKAAGKWNTNKGGEYYACLRRHALVHTDRGLVPAGQIQVGDRLANASGYVTVQAVYDSEHGETYYVAGLPCSAEHPIWTMNRGWVYAKDLDAEDLLCVESILDRMKALFRRVYGYLEHAHVPSLVQHQKPLHQPQQRKVGVVRRAWNRLGCAMANLRELCAGHGGAAQPAAYGGSNRCKRAVQPGELPLGNACGAGKQQAQQRAAGGRDASGTRTQAWGDAGNNSLSHGDGGRAPSPYEAAQAELRSYSAPEKLGWLRSAVARVLARSGASSTPGQPRRGAEGYLARLAGAAQKLLGLLVGVRPAGVIPRVKHSPTTPFVNFLTDGDHTFYADGVLTHNCGTGGALAGRGGHLIIIDDPHSEQDLKTGNFDSVDAAYDWFRLGLRTRLMPEGKLCILHTRWSQRDLIGRLTKEMVVNPEADQYEVFEFPAILTNDKGEEKSLWPEQWSLESLQRTRASMAPWMWNANYMQNPTARDSAIIKKDWIQWWESDTPPSCDFIVQAWDTALTTKDRSDYSVCHTWGVFYDEESGLQNAILLNSSKGKYEFPELKAKAHEEYEEWQPDSVIIEAKASGQPLIDEMRRSGIFVQDFSPGKGQDKIARLNSVADMFAAGQVWFPRRRWAEATVDEILTFPSGEHDDEVDATTLALARIRKGGLLPLHTDRKDDMDYVDISRPRNYY